ncbi:hypothetical protein BFJ68_g17095 [Fusarium oxysporum]|uniref:Uncharacterized protein n=1 Tax=Fusarium oxysporum TaxID=5507 RepID=A0A420P315_FUSOX|nr:hypothetical protein BFJ68_g17095 [Fusarium oxysporum]
MAQHGQADDQDDENLPSAGDNMIDPFAHRAMKGRLFTPSEASAPPSARPLSFY